MKRVTSIIRGRESVSEVLQGPSNNVSFRVGPWSKQEHKKFLLAIKTYGNSWGDVQKLIETRSCSQIKLHFSRCLRKLRATFRSNLLAGITLIANQSEKTDAPFINQTRVNDNFTQRESYMMPQKQTAKAIECLVLDELEVIRANEAEQGEEAQDLLFERWGDLLVPLENQYLQEYFKRPF